MLVAVVGSNEVSNPFLATEVYVKQNGEWKIGSLSFSHLFTTQAQGQNLALKIKKSQ